METPPIATIGALIGDPSRAIMLGVLMDGRARTASELASEAGVTRPTASAHLAKLAQGKLLVAISQGRHRYFQLASPDIATALEALMVVGAQRAPVSTCRPASPEREARSCYDHLAGRLGVALFDALCAKGCLELTNGHVALTSAGDHLMREIGVPLDAVARQRRMFASLCLDWSERRHHLGGALGAALLTLCLERKWLHREPGSRAVRASAAGKRELEQLFGLRL